MNLTVEDRAILSGDQGSAARWGLEHQVKVGEFFGADRLVPIRSAHIMCDAEATGRAGVELLERWADSGATVAVPTTIDPRSSDFFHSPRLGQDVEIVQFEHRILAALSTLGAMPSNTCNNYQVVDPPTYGEHLGWGDTGTVIYANSVAGARTNFEGGPAGLAAALCGRVANYGFHTDACRRGTARVVLDYTPQDSSEWGALGCIVGRAFPSYWEVPVFVGVDDHPAPDDLKQLGSSLASYGSQAMFHVVGITPEARSESEAFAGKKAQRELRVTREDIDGVFAEFSPEKAQPDLVVIGTPQLSLFEVKQLRDALAGRQATTPFFATMGPQVKMAADEFGYSKDLVEARVSLLTGVCFYLMTARDLARKNNFRTIVTNSAKLANIIAGYGYNPVFRRLTDCIDAAVAGQIPDSPRKR